MIITFQQFGRNLKSAFCLIATPTAPAEQLAAAPQLLLPNRFFDDNRIVVGYAFDETSWGLAIVDMAGEVQAVEDQIHIAVVPIFLVATRFSGFPVRVRFTYPFKRDSHVVHCQCIELFSGEDGYGEKPSFIDTVNRVRIAAGRS